MKPGTQEKLMGEELEHRIGRYCQLIARVLEQFWLNREQGFEPDDLKALADHYKLLLVENCNFIRLVQINSTEFSYNSFWPWPAP